MVPMEMFDVDVARPVERVEANDVFPRFAKHASLFELFARNHRASTGPFEDRAKDVIREDVELLDRLTLDVCFTGVSPAAQQDLRLGRACGLSEDRA